MALQLLLLLNPCFHSTPLPSNLHLQNAVSDPSPAKKAETRESPLLLLLKQSTNSHHQDRNMNAVGGQQPDPRAQEESANCDRWMDRSTLRDRMFSQPKNRKTWLNRVCHRLKSFESHNMGCCVDCPLCQKLCLLAGLIPLFG